MGIYIFGGLKNNNIATNELFFFRAHPKTYADHCIFDINCLEAIKPKICGKAPIPRFGHYTGFIQNKYLIIYGGYNCSLFKLTGSKIVNDVVLLNLQIFQWEFLACHGDIPDGRWNCSGFINGNKIIILVGKTEANTSDNSIYKLDFDFQ